MPSLRLVESASGATRLAEARAFLRAVPAGAESLIIGASRGAADDLARAVAIDRGATFGLQRFSFTQLAARLASAPLARDGLAPGTTLAGFAVAARALFEVSTDGSLEYFAPVAGTPGFPRALARTLNELRMAGVAAGSLAGLPETGPDLARLL